MSQKSHDLIKLWKGLEGLIDYSFFMDMLAQLEVTFIIVPKKGARAMRTLNWKDFVKMKPIVYFIHT